MPEKAPKRTRRLLALARGGVYLAPDVAVRAVRSYRTVSPLPASDEPQAARRRRRRSLLCGTFPGSAAEPVGVTHHRRSSRVRTFLRRSRAATTAITCPDEGGYVGRGDPVRPEHGRRMLRQRSVAGARAGACGAIRPRRTRRPPCVGRPAAVSLGDPATNRTRRETRPRNDRASGCRGRIAGATAEGRAGTSRSAAARRNALASDRRASGPAILNEMDDGRRSAHSDVHERCAVRSRRHRSRRRQRRSPGVSAPAGAAASPGPASGPVASASVCVVASRRTILASAVQSSGWNRLAKCPTIRCMFRYL